MKNLFIVRHAKSSWDDPGLSDRIRPLNERGEKDAPRMGKRLKAHGIKPDLVYSSHAVRALETAKIIVPFVDFGIDKIQVEPKLYHASENELLHVVRNAPQSAHCLMMVGHNPGLTEFVNDLLNEDIDNIPTAGIVYAQLRINYWKDADWKCGELLFFDYPKRKS